MDEPMKGLTGRQFGLIIAFLLPGFVGLLPTRHVSLAVKSWLGAAVEQGPTFGGFLYISLASLAVGVTISAVRRGVIDTLHHVTGVRRPPQDFKGSGKGVGSLYSDKLLERQENRHSCRSTQT